MPNRVTMELRGLRELQYALNQMAPQLERDKTVYRALYDGARVIVPEAKRRAPVLKDQARAPHRKPGEIRSNITYRAARGEKHVVNVTVRNRGYIFGAGFDSRRNQKGSHRAGNPNYWWLVHFGTSRQKADPFLYQAFEAKKFEAARTIQLSLLRGVFAIGRRLGFDVRSWADAA